MLPLLAVMAGAGCQQPTHTTTTSDTVVNAASDTSYREVPPEVATQRPPSTNIVMELRQRADSIRHALSSATPEQAAKMYHIFADAAILAIRTFRPMKANGLTRMSIPGRKKHRITVRTKPPRRVYGYWRKRVSNLILSGKVIQSCN
ncbi:hypothetical protein MKQ70_10545 [Chitinophaga sedimenti]|uniref:hypothetical protein n=1 Tax=Chitinophaga sedimenti TaxID=2033606 RepID=UPI0020065D5F|nr:hypothetical protein [Chitinophaga sedimenti]MCK7555420.1 hypothetical protein [Chitinophaga sedimenti]